jgi:hypothetical protein
MCNWTEFYLDASKQKQSQQIVTPANNDRNKRAKISRRLRGTKASPKVKAVTT